MFIYEKKLQFPVKIATPNPKLAAFIISQYGGPDNNSLKKIMPQSDVDCGITYSMFRHKPAFHRTWLSPGTDYSDMWS